MAKDPKKILAEIERLRAELTEAEKAEKQKKERAIIRAAERAGLMKLDWKAADFERAFRQIRERAELRPAQPEPAPASSFSAGEAAQ